MNNINYKYEVPFRSPFLPLINFKIYFTNKNICDLGCGSGDVILYIKNNFNPKSIIGIDKNNSSDSLNIKKCSIENYDFNDDINTYYVWIETPKIEINIINKLLKCKKQKTVIISYNTKSYICIKDKKCKICKWTSKIQNKIKELNNFLKNNNIKYKYTNYEYNDGNKCRQKGIFSYYIINNY
jgi:hypothetical protein